MVLWLIWWFGWVCCLLTPFVAECFAVSVFRLLEFVWWFVACFCGVFYVVLVSRNLAVWLLAGYVCYVPFG